MKAALKYVLQNQSMDTAIIGISPDEPDKQQQFDEIEQILRSVLTEAWSIL